MIKFLGGIALLLSMITSAIAVQPLSVSGKRILASGQQASFSGPSLFWSNVAWGGEKFYNADAIRWIKNDWKATIVRAAMGVEDGGGYIGSPDFNKAKVKAVVDAAIANDMYVIIDWHSHRAHDYRDAAVAFFQEMARTYGHHPNVIYEIYNEPLAVSWSNVIKPYAEAVAGAIRAIDPDNLIIVGTPNWSQEVDQASLDPITRYPNIAYTLHFYAGAHQQWLRDKAQTALNRNIALFVTEWGSVNADGNGGVNAAETWKWVDFMKTNHISNANWALNDKAEGASALVPGASTTGGWGDGQLTPSGKLAREITRGWPANGGPPSPPPPTPTCPAPATSPTTITVQAECYLSMQGVQTEDTIDVGGGKNVGYIDTGDWMSYPEVKIPSTGTYTVEYRVASGSSGGGSLQLEKAGGTQVYGTVSIPNTGGWQNWQTVSHTVNLNAGSIAFGIKAIGGGWNINWFRILTPPPSSTTITIQAESYLWMQGVQTEDTSDVNGGKNVGYIDTGDWMSYQEVTIQSTGAYRVEYRVASGSSGGSLQLDKAGGTQVYGTVSIPNTGGWQNWQTVSHTVNLNAGPIAFGIKAIGGGWNINWFRITK